MASNFVDQVSDSASTLAANVTDVALAVSQNVEEVVLSVSAGVGDVMLNVSSGVKRLVTSPPDEELDDKSDYNSILPTPDNSLILFEHSLIHGGFNSQLPPGMLTPESSSLYEKNFEENLNLSENYFSEPEIFDLGSNPTVEEIEKAITKTKDYILNCVESSHRRRILVQRIIQLRLALERCKEEQEVSKIGVLVHQGHHLTPVLSRPTSPSHGDYNIEKKMQQFCDKCSSVIWTVVHVVYRCSLCNYQCHGKCVHNTHPKCASLKFGSNPTFELRICPEIGLSAQDFRCSQCRRKLTTTDAWGEARLCDYTGRYFCPACHWNASSVIPARIIRNWDFDTRLVSQQAKHTLTFLSAKPLLRLEDLNPYLFKFVKELNVIKLLRENLLKMKDYLRTCRFAQESRLLRRLEARQHFVEDAKVYSLKDLVDLDKGVIIPFLKEIHEDFLQHIKHTCQACSGKGFICEICADTDVIFPFDTGVSICVVCHASFHSDCFQSVLSSGCPRCLRQAARRMAQMHHGTQSSEQQSDHQFIP